MGDECKMGLMIGDVLIFDVIFDEFGGRVIFLMIGLREMLDFLWVKWGWSGCFVLNNVYGFLKILIKFD